MATEWLEQASNSERDARLKAEDALRRIKETAEDALGWDDAGDWAMALNKVKEIAAE